MGTRHTKRPTAAHAPMSQIIYSEQAQTDLNRLYRFLVEKDVEVAQRAMFQIDQSIKTQLSKNPKICREIGFGLREFIIRFGRNGYIALFDLNEKTDTVEILAIRHQLEDGYKD
jgi:plasmid stabilization system protein ParE